MNIQDKLLKILKEINPDLDYANEKELVDGGQFDSLEVMSIVAEMEDAFHIEIDPDDVIAENFNSIGSMKKIVAKYL